MSVLQKGSDHERRSARWDLETLPSNYGALVLGQAASALLSFVAVWLAVKGLGSEGYGGIVALVAASQLVGQAAVQWTAIALFRHGCREFVEEGRIAKAFWNRLAILAANLFVLALASPWWLPRVADLLSLPREGRWIVALHLFATSVSVHAQQALQAAKLPRFQSLVQFLERLAIVSVLVASLLAGGLRWQGAALAFALSPLLAACLAFFRLRRLVLPLPGIDANLIREMIRFSCPLILFSVIGYFTTNHLDAVFIVRFLSPSDLGVYAIAYQIAGVFMQIPSLLGSLLMAYFITADTEGDHARLENFFRSVLPALTLGLSVAAAIGALSGSLLIHAFFGDEFGRARALLWPLLAAAALAAPVTLAFGPAANARSRTSIAAMAAIVSAATNTLLNFLLIPAFGISGCAWATTAAFGGSLLMFLSLAPREISAHRGWTLYAALPVLAGAVLGAQGREWSGLGVALSASAALGAFHARDVRGALQAFFSLPAIESMFLVGRGARARMEVR